MSKYADLRYKIVKEWGYGLYENYSQIAKKYHIAYNTVKSYLQDSGVKKGEYADEFERSVAIRKNAISNPTQESLNLFEEEMRKVRGENGFAYELFSVKDVYDPAMDKALTEIQKEITERLINSNIIATQVGIGKMLNRGKREIILGGAKDGFSRFDVELSPEDYKKIAEINDMTLVSIGVADRFAPKGDVNVVQANNNQTAEIEYKTVLPEASEEEEEALEYIEGIVEKEAV